MDALRPSSSHQDLDLWGNTAAAPTVRQVAADTYTFVRVAVERGTDHFPDGLTYAVPDGCNAGSAAHDTGGDNTTEFAIAAGDAVRVPLGRSGKETFGWVTAVGGRELCEGLDETRVKFIISREGTRLPSQLLELARWISAYYCCPLGMTLAALLPSAVRKRIGETKRILLRRAVTQTAVEIAESSDADSRAGPKVRKLSKQQSAVLAALDRMTSEVESADGGGPAPTSGECTRPREVEMGDLTEAAGLKSTAPIRTLIKRGLILSRTHSVIEAKWMKQQIIEVGRPSPTKEQHTAISQISAALAAGFSQHLLFGVTGSGKTEVYLSLIESTLSRGKSAIMLVPEIALTPQTTGRLLSRLGAAPVLLLHSGLTSAQRHEQWYRAGIPGPKVVLGARSAVFAPIPDGELGLIVVDEEHDHSYKQDQAPRYNGRDAAIRRAQIAGCAVVLGSATPSLESWHNATVRRVSSLHRMAQRAPGLTTPRVQIVDFRSEMAQWSDRRVHQIGPTLQAALRQTLTTGGQAILLLNRRGYANYVGCVDQRCRWELQCDHCSARMVVHKGETDLRRLKFMRCHHCGAEQRLPQHCPACDKRLSVFGLGTQRIEEELHQLLPDLEEGMLARVDSDSTTTAQDFHEVLGRFARGEIRILLGTQMIAKGLDFPGVTLVGVISADTAMNMPDFRAAERTFQLVSQVCGRCGRGAAGGLALVQTFQPDAAPIIKAAQQDFESFAAAELKSREQFGLPPATRMARIVVKAPLSNKAKELAQQIAEGMAGLTEATSVIIDGPNKCAIDRIADRFRFQIEIRAASASTLSSLLSAARSRGIIRLSESVAVDVDPTALL